MAAVAELCGKKVPQYTWVLRSTSAYFAEGVCANYRDRPDAGIAHFWSTLTVGLAL
jgi:hypothetical protein